VEVIVQNKVARFLMAHGVYGQLGVISVLYTKMCALSKTKRSK